MAVNLWSKYERARKEAIFSIAFLALFLSLDGASTTAQTWEGAPPTYLPVALSLALLIWCGSRYIPLVLISSVIAAAVNYHRAPLSWGGIPGACAIYAGYVLGAMILRGKWRIDPRLSTLRDVGRFVAVSAGGALVSTIIGVATLLLDGLVHRPETVAAAVDWYASDIIGIVTFVPFLLIFVAPLLGSWLHPGDAFQRAESLGIRPSWNEIPEWIGQTAVAVVAIWVLFTMPVVTPYQPLYLLFVPLVWAGVRRGMPGAAFITAVVSIAMVAAAGLTHAPHGSMPRLQLATLILGLTGLCLGAMVSERKRAEIELRRSERGLKESQRVARLGSWTLDVASGEVKWTEELYRMFGLDPTSPPPRIGDHQQVLSPESFQQLENSIANTIKTGRPYEIELQIVRPDRSDGWIWARGEIQRSHDGTGTALSGIAQDITERKRAEETLSFKTTLLEAQSENSIDGVLVVDESGRVVLANKQFGIHFDLPDELLAAADDRLVLEYFLTKVDQPTAFLGRVKYLYNSREEKSRDEFRLKNGKVFDRYSAPLLDAKGAYRGRIWYFRDITARKRSEERAQFLAYYDALTGLPNRALLHDRVDKALARARRQQDKVALLFLDLDRFKAINDSLGHSVGDLLLKEVANRLKKWGREQDTVARLGGDEFLIMLSDMKKMEDAAVSADRLMKVLTEEFKVLNHTLHIGCSVGISVFPEHGWDTEMLIRNADAAMYCAKESGRNTFKLFTAAMNAQAAQRLVLENALRTALDHDELFLMYQPQMELATGRVTGLEALLRWRHPKLGLIPPDRFINIAENSGQIVGIGMWVLRTACAQARRWQDEGLPPVTVAVNVSVVQLRQEGFAKLVRDVLEETGLDPKYLELEITESLLLANEELMTSILQQLQGMGVALAIDDFGTGYSSFSYLRQFRANKFKIDRSFIRDVARNPDDAAITSAMISMAKSLRLTVIAEGVEDEVQMTFLREQKCDQIQGYYFSKPLPVEQVAEKLRAAPTLAAGASAGI